MRYEKLIREIEDDNTSGATTLTERGAEALALLAEESKAQSTAEFLEELLNACQALIEAQPSMASLFNLVNGVLLRVDGLTDLGATKRAVKETSAGFTARLQEAMEEISQRAAGLIEDGATVMTHSYSSTVLRALLRAQEMGKCFRMICTESRPMLEGQALARRLGEAGIETTLIVDAALCSLMPQQRTKVQLALVGADSVSTSGLVNKTGTHGLALAAKTYQVPLYALCGTEKFWPSALPSLPPIESKDGAEIMAEPTENVEVINRYFDVTPLEYFAGIVTERGILSARDVGRALDEMRVHRRLQS